MVAPASKLDLSELSFPLAIKDRKSNQDYFNSTNPFSREKNLSIADCTKEQVDEVVSKARYAFENTNWSSNIEIRKKVLFQLAQIIEDNKDDLAYLDTIDMGMPISTSKGLNVSGAAAALRYYAENIDKHYNKIAPTSEPNLTTIKKVPIGIVAAVVAWNVPLLVEFTKVAPALAAGNAVILKPAEQSSLSALLVEKLFKNSDLPEGVFQVVTGFGENSGQFLAKHNDVDCITFTGSTDTGKKIMSSAANSNLKKVSLECGGKSPHIVFSDYPDLSKAAKIAANSIFFNSGQVCISSSRLLVERNIYDQFLSLLRQNVQAIEYANPLEESCSYGPIANAQQYDKVLMYINYAHQNNIKMLLGHDITKESCNDGYYVAPTVYYDVPNDSRLIQEEIFGPVLCVQPFDTVEEAADLANSTVYGLGASIWVGNIPMGYNLANKIKAGMIRVNSVGTGGFVTPFGGFKQSGIGRDKSVYTIDEYTETQSVMFDMNYEQK